MQLDLKTARRKKKLSLNQLAAASGINKSTICRLENGERVPSYDTVVALERALGLKPGRLIFQRAVA